MLATPEERLQDQAITVPSVDEPRREVEAAHPVAADVDEEPGLQEVLDGDGQRLGATADFRPAGARFLSDPFVPDEPVPAVLAAARRGAVARAERDPAPDSEAALRPVVAGREPDRGHPAAVEGDLDLASVQPVAQFRLGAVCAQHPLLRLAERDVADP